MQLGQEFISQRPRVLCVDDEFSVLESLQRILKRAGCLVDIECSPIDALNKVVENQYDIIISDMRMPEMNGASFLAKSQAVSPSSMRILLTGYSDQNSTVKAVNEGKIHSYVSKPWDNKELRELISDSLEQKRKNDLPKQELIREKLNSRRLHLTNSSLAREVNDANACLRRTCSLLGKTANELEASHKQTVKVFSNLLDLKCVQIPESREIMVEHCHHIAEELGFNQSIIHDIENAIYLFDLGTLALPEGIRVNNPTDLNAKNLDVYKSHPLKAEELLFPMQYMQGVSDILGNFYENFDGSGFPRAKSAKGIPIAARLLRIIVDFYQQKHLDSNEVAQNHLLENAGRLYDPELVMLYVHSLSCNKFSEQQLKQTQIAVGDLELGQKVCRDLYGVNGMLLLASGTVITERIRKTLEDYESNRPINLSVTVTN